MDALSLIMMKKTISNSLLLMAIILSSDLCAGTKSILVIKTDDNSYHQSTINQFKSGTSDISAIDELTLTNKNTHIEFDNYNLIITLGMKAAQQIAESNVKLPVISSYITNNQLREMTPGLNQTIVLLEQPLTRYIKFIKRIIPADNIALLKPKDNSIPDNEIDKISQKLSIKINQVLIDDSDNRISAVRDLLEQSSALLALPDPEIYNRSTIKGILLTTYRARKPLISYSPSHVRSGALASIFASPKNIGTQLADLTRQLLLEPDNRLHRVYYSSYCQITFNQKIADSLNIELPSIKSISQTLKLETTK